MKNIITTSIFFLCSIICIAQNDVLKAKADSLSQVSRVKADLILSHFDRIRSKKILYSILDEQYYVILKDGDWYKEYYIHTDSTGNISEQRLAKTSKENTKLFAKAFNINAYRKDFVTKVNNPTVDQGNSSYFVLRDIDGRRYGEYSLSVITKPIPIDKQLYVYLLARLLKESTNKPLK